MKKVIVFICVFLCVSFAFTGLTACDKDKGNNHDGGTTTTSPLEGTTTTTPSENSKPVQTVPEQPTQTNTSGAEQPLPSPQITNVDIDLTKMSSTMVYAKVYDLVSNPEEYQGKTIKVDGTFQTNYWESTQTRYYFVYIADATACCAQGLEFIYNGSHEYPNDYPEIDSEIELVGVYDSYLENGSTYYYLSVNNIKLL